jgi:hypothetical protein
VPQSLRGIKGVLLLAVVTFFVSFELKAEEYIQQIVEWGKKQNTEVWPEVFSDIFLGDDDSDPHANMELPGTSSLSTISIINHFDYPNGVTL